MKMKKTMMTPVKKAPKTEAVKIVTETWSFVLSLLLLVLGRAHEEVKLKERASE